jgi:hypothetical protein
VRLSALWSSVKADVDWQAWAERSRSSATYAVAVPKCSDPCRRLRPGTNTLLREVVAVEPLATLSRVCARVGDLYGRERSRDQATYSAVEVMGSGRSEARPLQ